MINKFCGERDWIRNLAQDPATASNTSVCLTLDLDKDQVRAAKGGNLPQPPWWSTSTLDCILEG